MFDLTGRTALVTGASGSIGATIATCLAVQGAAVIGADLTPSDTIRPLDVTNEASWKTLAQAIGESHGHLDILVNCAGIAPMGKIEELDLDAWRRTMAVNVEGVAIGTKTLLPLLRAAEGRHHGGPSIINIASAAANRPSALSAAYCASKAAVSMFTKVTAVEFSELGYGIRVNSVHPGVVNSVMMTEILKSYSRDTGNDPAELTSQILSRYPIKRFADPREVATAVVYLASSEAAYVHGTEQHVDGGYLGS